MLTLCVLAAAAAACGAWGAHSGDPRAAAIVHEQRYLAGDGAFGAAYRQEDGTRFREESDARGDRRGSYSYVDPSGARRTVHYTAGADGFRVSDADSAPLHSVYTGLARAQYSGVQPAQPAPAPAPEPAPAAHAHAEPAPQRFSPPGKFHLNRSPDGFHYTFSQQ